MELFFRTIVTTSCWLHTWELSNSSNKFAPNLTMKGISSFISPCIYSIYIPHAPLKHGSIDQKETYDHVEYLIFTGKSFSCLILCRVPCPLAHALHIRINFGSLICYVSYTYEIFRQFLSNYCRYITLCG